MPIIVKIVTTPKMAVTITRLHKLPMAAGYISRGISGSQGPKINIVKRTHGVMLFFPSWAWTCRCASL